jgi:hypothetical protein
LGRKGSALPRHCPAATGAPAAAIDAKTEPHLYTMKISTDLAIYAFHGEGDPTERHELIASPS